MEHILLLTRRRSRRRRVAKSRDSSMTSGTLTARSSWLWAAQTTGDTRITTSAAPQPGTHRIAGGRNYLRLMAPPPSREHWHQPAAVEHAGMAETPKVMRYPYHDGSDVTSTGGDQTCSNEIEHCQGTGAGLTDHSARLDAPLAA